MDVTPQELRSSEIKDSWRGYDRDEVDDLLERAAVTIEGLTQRVQESSRPVPAVAQESVPLPTNREDADMLQRTLLMAQRAADDAVNEAQARARTLVDEAEAKAQVLVSDAEASARRIAEGERQRLEAEIHELASRRDTLSADADALDDYTSNYRDRLRAAIEADLARLGSEIEPPGTRPEVHDVDVTPRAVPETPAASEPAPPVEPPRPAEPARVPEPVARAAEPTDAGGDAPRPAAPWDSGPDTRAIRTVGAAPEPFAAAPVAAPPRPTEWPPPAPEASGRAAETYARADAADASWLTEPDEWSTAESSWDSPPPWEREAPRGAGDPSPSVFASEVPMEANAVDDDVLDDDAFFASLREAVRDDAALGPADDPAPSFFDAEVDDRRRFRRRR